MNIIQRYVTNNPRYKLGTKITPKGIMLHSVGCPQPSALVFANTWNRDNANAEVHGVIQSDGIVYQCFPWNVKCYHAGGSANNTHIGIEMTEPSCIKYTNGSSFTCSDYSSAKWQVKGTYENSVELFAYLCKLYNLNPMTSIISHKEGCAKGIASNHSDPEHLWRGLGLPYTMDSFRQAVSEKVSQGSYFTIYLVKVTASVLNVRKGPSTSFPVTTTIRQNEVFTIVDEQNGWGKLKSGAGWICLRYTQRR